MELKQLSFNFNRIIYILRKIFVDANNYQITSTRVDELNNQLDLFIQYEITIDEGTYIHSPIIGIPNWVLEQDANSKDIEDFITMMKDQLEF